MICNYLKKLDSGFRRNDDEGGCWTFCETVKFIMYEKIDQMISLCSIKLITLWAASPASTFVESITNSGSSGGS